jgi:hypothetical protein
MTITHQKTNYKGTYQPCIRNILPDIKERMYYFVSFFTYQIALSSCSSFLVCDSHLHGLFDRLCIYSDDI